MIIFPFEPGDGVSYQVLFGRVESPVPHLFPYYTVFGFGEAGDALITLTLNSEYVGAEAFFARWASARHTRALGAESYLAEAAFAVFCALTGPAPAGLVDWAPDWAARIPARARS